LSQGLFRSNRVFARLDAIDDIETLLKLVQRTGEVRCITSPGIR